MRIKTQKVGVQWNAWVDGEPSKRATANDKNACVTMLQKRFPNLMGALVSQMEPVGGPTPPTREEQKEAVLVQIETLLAKLAILEKEDDQKA